MSPSKLTARSSLQISFKTASFLFRSERDCCFDLPLFVLCCMWTFSTIMLAQPRIKVARYAAVMRFLVGFTCGDVNVVESGGREEVQNGPPMLCSGVAAPKAFGAGGKGIRTPDFQLAKLALYQLSYAPIVSRKSL